MWKRQEVLLRINYDAAKCSEPSRWDWADLIDVSDREDVFVVSCTEPVAYDGPVRPAEED